MYLTAQMDWFSRYVISWELDQTLEIDFVLACLRQALAKADPILQTVIEEAIIPAANTRTYC